MIVYDSESEYIFPYPRPSRVNRKDDVSFIFKYVEQGCVCVCVYVCLYAHTCVCVCVYIKLYAHTFHIYVCMYVGMHACMYACIRYVCIYVCIFFV